MGFSLSQLGPVRGALIAARMWLFRRLGMDIRESVRMSLTARPDLTFPRGVHIGENSYVAFGARILTHDFTRGLYLHTRIGRNCFIGGDCLVLPGVTIGDQCIIAAGSVVTGDVPPRSVVAGNPARVIRSEIEVGPFGRFLDADENEQALRASDPDVAALPYPRKDK